MNDNIIYCSTADGIIICQTLDRTIERMIETESFPIILRRNSLGIRFEPLKKMPKHPWQHKIIMDTFEKIGWPVKITLNGRYYSLKNKKDRFRFKLKYGSI